MKFRRMTALLLAVWMILAASSISVFASEDDIKDFGDFDLLFDNEGWKVFPVENKEDSLYADDLRITVVDGGGKIVPADAYELVFGKTYWDDEKQEDVFTPISEPFCLTADDDYMHSGFGGFAAYAVAKDDSGYTGQTDPREFMLWHKNSFNWFGANADFGEEYEGQCTWSWHNYYMVPLDQIAPPVIHGIAFEGVDPEFYEITYFERGENPAFDDPDYDRKLYPEDDPLPGLPTEFGRYFAKIDGKAPYYGTSYVDFDIFDSFAAEHGKDRRYFDGDTLYIKQGEATDIHFDTEPVGDGYLVGWMCDDLTDKGFDVPLEPVFFEGDDRAYAHIGAGALSPGTRGVMTYSCYRFFDVFRDGMFRWDEAEPLYTRTLNVEVAPDDFSYLLGDANGDGEVDIVDATVIQRELEELDGGRYSDTIMRGDVDENEKLEIIDATYLMRSFALMRVPCDIGKPIG